MTEYIVQETLFVSAGTLLGLTSAQAGARAYGVEDLGDGAYRATQKLCFKKGERIALVGDLGRAAMAKLAPADATSRPAGASDSSEGEPKKAAKGGKAAKAAELQDAAAE